jgi:AmiR/NasT family two-component response regulator
LRPAGLAVQAARSSVAFLAVVRPRVHRGGIAARLAAQAVLTDQLRTSLASRAVIDQALGIIMGQQRCTAAEAFDILRSAAQNRNLKIREIAEQIITSITGQPPQEPPFHAPS